MTPPFERLLDTGPEETVVQAFLEAHPAMVCGTDYVMASSLISKLPLGKDFVPDFAYVNPQSGRTFLKLFEIKKPDARIFTKHDQFTHRFQRAYQQVEDYIGWCHRNGSALRELL